MAQTIKQRLTAAQYEVLSAMADGWELGASTSVLSRGVWLQRNGIGSGGLTESVRRNTLNALHNKGWIEKANNTFPTQTFRLTDAGKEVLEACKR